MITAHPGIEYTGSNLKEEAPTLGHMLKDRLAQRQADMVNNPPHYNLGPMQVIDIRDILLDRIEKSGVLSYKQADYWSRSWEYQTRFMEKGGAEDLRKAKYYLDRLVKSFDK
jgi:hypothetical protein